MKDERKDSVLGRTEMLQKREEMRSKGRARGTTGRNRHVYHSALRAPY